MDRLASLSSATVTTQWRTALPVLHGRTVVLREPRASDAPALHELLTAQAVARFISPPPPTVKGFERFIAWTAHQRAAGGYVCFAVTLRGGDAAIGLFQIRELEPGFGVAEWGFALGSPFWVTGVFAAAAPLVVDFAFDVIGAHRLEARAATRNGRGNGALRKMGAVREGLLRRSFERHGEYFDQALWAIVDDEWRDRRAIAVPAV